MSWCMTKPTKRHVHPAKTKISLGILPSLIRVFAEWFIGRCPGWSEPCRAHRYFFFAFFYAAVMIFNNICAASSEFGTYRICEQRRFRRACASAVSRQNLRCSLIQAMGQEEPSDRKPDPWPLWMAGHAQLKFVMMECSKTQIRLTRPIFQRNWHNQYNYRTI